MTGQTRATPPPSVRTQAVPVHVYRHTRVSHPLLDGAEKRVTASDVRSPSFPPLPRWHTTLAPRTARRVALWLALPRRKRDHAALL